MAKVLKKNIPTSFSPIFIAIFVILLGNNGVSNVTLS